jgi:LacI family transcriptional regulator
MFVKLLEEHEMKLAASSAPKMSDVATRAGVSAGTVSNTLNNPDVVSEQTRARVWEAIDELGFVRNAAASGLASRASNTVGVVLIDLSNSLFLSMARGIEREATAVGIKVLLTNSDIDREKQDDSLRFFDEMRTAGVILAPLEGDLGVLDEVRRHGRTVVLLNHPAPEAGCGVVVDEERGGYLAARHLIEQGRTRLAFAGSPRFSVIGARLEGAKRAVAEAGGTPDLEVIETSGVRLRHGHEVGEELLSRLPEDRPDGLVAASDLLAVGVIQKMHRHDGVEVPRDLAIVGYDNNAFASDSAIAVTTIAQPAEEMGATAFRLLLEEAHGDPRHVHRTVVLEPELIERTSSGTPAG